MKRYRPSRHVALHAIELLALFVVLAGVLLGFGVVGRSRDALKVAAMSAARAVSNAPSEACNPPIGGGSMGACAPTQAFAATDAIAKAAGDPETITGHPLGVDVSSNNGCRHFSRADAFVIIKATESTLYTNTCLAGDVAYAKSLGIAYGVYDFLRAGLSTPQAEAAYFVAAVKAENANTSLPPTADVEVNAGLSPAALHAYVDTWEKYVKAALGRTVVITYTGAWFWTPSVGGSAEGDLWVSGYGPSVTTPGSWTISRAVAPFGSIVWTFWQYSDGTYGPAPHLGADSDVFGGTLAQLKVLASTTFVGHGAASSGSANKPTGSTTTATETTTAKTSPSGIYHYERFTKAEARAVKRYDNLRAHAKTRTAALRQLRHELLAEARVVARRALGQLRYWGSNLYRPRPAWGEFWRGWRFQQLIARSRGLVIHTTK